MLAGRDAERAAIAALLDAARAGSGGALVVRGVAGAAAQLFVSPRTVDLHLRNVFGKLGVTSRAEPAALPLDV